MWLPETAVDLATLRVAAEAGVRGGDPRARGRPTAPTSITGGRTGSTSAAAATSPRCSTTGSCPRPSRSSPPRPPMPTGSPASASRRGSTVPSRTAATRRSSSRPTASCTATTSRSVTCSSSGSSRPRRASGRSFDVVGFHEAVAEADGHPHPEIRIRDRTSWSCHHGVLRWTAECPDVPDGRWKGPLRAALERLAGGDRQRDRRDRRVTSPASTTPGRPATATWTS